MEDNRKKRTKAPDRPLTPKKLKLLVTVVNKNKAEFYVDFLQQYEINLQLQMRAMGTAGSELLHYLGLEESEKQVIFSIVREDMAPAALRGLEEKFATLKGGKGIAYTVPLSSAMGVAIYQFLSNNQMSGKDKK
ncbi:MAG: hypothetical protein E7620_02595 [Ruminococcaceae bacterium]|nr:hypothetical protein [Oscillospiraceae bacterium]